MTAGYRDRVVLHAASMSIDTGQIMAILGPNGAGKSTLIKAALGLVPPLAGSASFFGEPLSTVRHRVGYMPQVAAVDWDFPATVGDVVLMGTYGRLGWLRRPSRAQYVLADEAMDRLSITDLADRHISELSGGQKQRTFLARTLAGEPDLLLLDEPFAGVDIASALAITDVLRGLAAEGRAIGVVHHDLGTVKDFCTHATLLREGRVEATGPLDQAFTPATIHRAYGLAEVIPE
nr:ABC transporter ATP-binding protein [Trueperella bernardiae]